MALTAERYREVKAELEQIEARLFALAAEIDSAAAVTEKQGFIYQAAYRAGDAVAHLRYMLRMQQEQEQLQRRLYGAPRK